ncbi:MAG: ABC transporter ATP-binding protein [Eubacteriales bacterium]|nr:ABC transporter ATP-binding protein [Eubacteriales bacterium]
MIAYLQKKFALSEEGARGMRRSIVWSALMNLSFILPIGIIFNFLTDATAVYILHTADHVEPLKYFLLMPAVVLVMFWVNLKRYDATYTVTYTETAKTRVALSRHIAKLPMSYFGKRDLSDLTKTIMTDVEKMEHAYSHAIPPFFGTILSVIIMAVMIAVQSPWLALAMIWPFPLAVGLVFAFRKRKYRLEKRHADDVLAVSAKMQEMMDNILAIKAFGRTKKSMDELEEILTEEEHAHYIAERSNPLFLAPLYALFRIGIVTVVLVGYGEYAAGAIDLSMYLTFLVISCILYVPMESAMAFLMEFIYISVSVDRMNELRDCPVMTGTKETVDTYDIEVKNLTFAYDKEAGDVLRDVSFTAKQGEVTALVGPSGCGKSTLTSLMLRFYDPDKGEITLGGKNIRGFDPDILLTNYAMVFQNVQLFNNTIMENIRIGKKGATDEEVLAAAKVACVDEIAARLPDGYETRIGESGGLLSGGERQRISIARAVLKDAPIIFLDESTASVDADSESRIQTALSRLIQDKTVVVIAHRLRTVMKADKILVLEEGRLIEEGTSDELIAKGGLFQKLWELQKRGA